MRILTHLNVRHIYLYLNLFQLNQQCHWSKNVTNSSSKTSLFLSILKVLKVGKGLGDVHKGPLEALNEFEGRKWTNKDAIRPQSPSIKSQKWNTNWHFSAGGRVSFAPLHGSDVKQWRLRLGKRPQCRKKVNFRDLSQSLSFVFLLLISSSSCCCCSSWT